MPVTIGGSGPITGVTSINTTVSDTELGYLDGLTEPLTTSLAAKAPVSSVGLTYITKGSVTSGSALSINNCFTSSYANYLVVVTGLYAASAVTVRLRNSGSDRTDNAYITQEIVSYGSTTTSSNITQTSIPMGAISAEGFLMLDFFAPQQAGSETWVMTRMYGYQSNITSFATRTSGTNYNTVNGNDGFSILGTTISATAYVYGYQTP